MRTESEAEAEAEAEAKAKAEAEAEAAEEEEKAGWNQDNKTLQHNVGNNSQSHCTNQWFRHV